MRHETRKWIVFPLALLSILVFGQDMFCRQGGTPRLTGIELAPASMTLTNASPSQQLQVTGLYSNGSQQDLSPASAGTTYTTSDSDVAVVSADGLVTAKANGQAIITAINSGFSDVSIATITLTPEPFPDMTDCVGERTLHVAPSGDDNNPGTETAPWRTIQHAADSVVAGDAVHIHAGTYTEDVLFSVSGTASDPICFSAAAGESVTLHGAVDIADGVAYMSLANMTIEEFPIWGVTLAGNNSYISLAGLAVLGGEAGIHFTHAGPVSDIIVENCVVQGCMYTGVDCTPGPCDRMTFRNLDISGAGISGEDSFGADGLAVERGRDITVEDCYIHDNGGDGIDLNSRDTAGNVTGIVVRRNLVAGNHLQAIKLWSGGRMENNVVWGQGINPVVIGVYPGTFEVVNNTIAYNMYSPRYGGRDYAFIAAYPETGASASIDLTLVNNIFAFNTGPAVGTPTALYLGEGVNLVAESHNLYWSREDGEIEAAFVTGRDPFFTRAEIADGTWAAATGQGTGNVTEDPQFVAGWPDVDLRLQEGSPAADAGTAANAPADDADETARPVGSGYDIGAYER